MPRPEVTGSSAFKNYELSFLSGRIEFRRIILDNADLSYSDFTDVIWKNCNLSNVDFRSARLRGVGFWSCSLTNISFDGSDLRDAVLDGANGSSPSSFVDVNFCKVNLESTGGGLPLFRNCDFSNANLRKVDFDGARFENCKFAGLLYDVAFRPHASIYVASACPGSAWTQRSSRIEWSLWISAKRICDMLGLTVSTYLRAHSRATRTTSLSAVNVKCF